MWCSHCGMSLDVLPTSVSSVRCTFCHRITRMKRDGGELDGSMSVTSPSLPQVPRTRGCKKRALLVGVSYMGTPHELRGTFNDVKAMRRLLVDKFGFTSECILELTERELEPHRVPTRENLIAAMRWLVSGSDSGDSLVFHFSGHGVQNVRLDGGGVDGYGDALCPVDFERSGTIIDQEIGETMVQPLGIGVKLHAIVDTSHGCAILNLPYRCQLPKTRRHWRWESLDRASGMATYPSGGLAISIGGWSNNNQSSLDTTAFSGSISSDSVTYSFVKALESEPSTTYGRLLRGMRAAISDNGRELGISGPMRTFFRRVITVSSSQEPQLGSSEMFDIYRKPFIL
ncbi:unnamed protein product [Urochloa humidicola]